MDALAERPSGLCDPHYASKYIYGRNEPGTGNAFALICSAVNTASMQKFFDKFAETIGADEHVALVLDGAGWHGAKALRVPSNITLIKLPPYSPELNPVERVWLFLKERFLSMRLLNDGNAIDAAVTKAWKLLLKEAGRIASLTAYPWIMKVKP